MIALAFLLDQIMGVPKINCHIWAVIRTSGSLNQLVILLSGFMLPILAGYIAYSIVEKPGLIAGFATRLLRKQVLLMEIS